MNKILPIIVLLASTSIGAHGPFQSGFFNQGFNDGFWQDFDRQFQQLDRRLNQLKHSTSVLRTHSRQYFDKDSNSYVMEVKLSGLGKEDIDISAHKNTLVIKGVRHNETTSDNQSARSSTSFSHSISIPRDGDKDNISADFKDGVLKVSIPKLDKPRSQVQKISIN